MEARPLQDKKALVVGGSRGIGRAIVLELLRRGAHVLFTYAGNTAAAHATVEHGRAISPRVMAVKADLAQPSEMRSAFQRLSDLFGGEPDLYIASAFPAAVFAPTAVMTDADYDSMFAAVRGHYFALQEAARRVRDGGGIVVLSSGAAAMPQPASGAYAGAKAAIERFALSLAHELGPRQVRVNVVSPGVTETDGLVAPQAMIDMLVQQTPLGRLGRPDEIASSVAALCGPELAWVHGQIVQVNGGIL